MDGIGVGADEQGCKQVPKEGNQATKRNAAKVIQEKGSI